MTREQIAFGELQIAYDERVLEPRDWTTAQSYWAAELLARAPTGDVLELCSGAGQIGLLAVRRSQRRLVCVDLNPVALAFTIENAEAAGMGTRVETREGRIKDVLHQGERFALVIADPPWVARAELARYSGCPLLAIDGGESGMTVVAECVAAIESHLAPGGSAILQLGSERQADAVRELLTAGSGVSASDVRAYSEPEWGHLGVLLRLDR